MLSVSEFGFGGKDVALGSAFGAQGFVVFDDAVAHDGDAAGDVGVSIMLGGCALGGPAGVGDAGAGGGIARGGFQFGDAADRADAVDAFLPDAG